MRVVCLLPLPPPATGQSVVTATFLDGLARVAEVDVVDTADRVHVWRRAGTLPPARAAAWLGRLRAFARALRRRPDVVYLTPASSVLGFARDVAALALVPRGVRIVAHAHMGDFGGLFARRGVGALARRTARRYELILVPSDFSAVWIRRTLPDARVEVIPNPVSPELRFSEDDEAAARAARQGRAPNVLFLSNMIPAKGYVPLAHALSTLAARGRDFTATFAGSWACLEDRDAFATLIETLGIADRSTITGAVPHDALRPVLAAADVLAFPSAMPESFGMGMLEAMGAGAAVVASDHAAAPEIVRDGLDGRLVPPGDAAALVEALDDALANRDRYGRSAAARVRAAFAPEPLVAAFVAALTGDSTAADAPAGLSSGQNACLSSCPPPSARSSRRTAP